eukprot:scaffold2979_cov405-Prasinococcus_capsulatus_cf.AAC.2
MASCPSLRILSGQAHTERSKRSHRAPYGTTDCAVGSASRGYNAYLVASQPHVSQEARLSFPVGPPLAAVRVAGLLAACSGSPAAAAPRLVLSVDAGLGSGTDRRSPGRAQAAGRAAPRPACPCRRAHAAARQRSLRRHDDDDDDDDGNDARSAPRAVGH